MENYGICGKFTYFPDLTSKRITEGGKRLNKYFKSSSKQKPLVSIITVVLNNYDSLQRCIDSVKHQTYANIEYILIDGGSEKKTLDIICREEDFIDYFVSEPDKGIYHAINKGINLAKGEYICVLNSDDWYEKEFIEKSLYQARLTEASIVYCHYKINDTNHITPGINDGIYLHNLNINHSTLLVHKDTYNKIGPYNENYKIVSDAIWVRNAYKKRESFILIQEILLNYSSGGLSSLSSKKMRNIRTEEVISSYKEHFNFLSDQHAKIIYVSRFEKNMITKFPVIINSYSEQKYFMESLKKYFEFSLDYLDNYIFSEEDVRKLIPLAINLCKFLDISVEKIRIN